MQAFRSVPLTAKLRMSRNSHQAIAPYYAFLLDQRNLAHTGAAGVQDACIYTKHEGGASRRMFLVPQIQYGHAAPSNGVFWPILPRVEFRTSTPGGIDPGLPLSHIHNGADYFAQSPHLVGAADQIILGDRMKITHRLEVMLAGAELPLSWSRQVSARKSTRNREPLTRYTVACHIAKTVWQCIWSCGGRWMLRDGTAVRYEDLMLLELVRVSSGSHQIVLGYLEPKTHALMQTPLAYTTFGNEARNVEGPNGHFAA